MLAFFFYNLSQLVSVFCGFQDPFICYFPVGTIIQLAVLLLKIYSRILNLVNRQLISSIRVNIYCLGLSDHRRGRRPTNVYSMHNTHLHTRDRSWISVDDDDHDDQYTTSAASPAFEVRLESDQLCHNHSVVHSLKFTGCTSTIIE